MNANEDQDLKTARKNVKIMFNDEGLNAINAGFCYIFAPFRTFIGDKDFVKIIREFKSTQFYQQNKNNINNITDNTKFNEIINRYVENPDQAKKVKILIEAILNNTDENGQLFSNNPTYYYSQPGYKTRFINLITKLCQLGDNEHRYDYSAKIENLLTIASRILSNEGHRIERSSLMRVSTDAQLQAEVNSWQHIVEKSPAYNGESLSKKAYAKRIQLESQRKANIETLHKILKDGKVLKVSGDHSDSPKNNPLAHFYNIAMIRNEIVVIGTGGTKRFKNILEAIESYSNFNNTSKATMISWPEIDGVKLDIAQQNLLEQLRSDPGFKLNPLNDNDKNQIAEEQNLFSQSINNNKIIAQKELYHVPVQNTTNFNQNKYQVLKKVNNTMPNNIIAQSSNVVNLKSFNPNNLNKTQGQANKIPNPQAFGNHITTTPKIITQTVQKPFNPYAKLIANKATYQTSLQSNKNYLQNYQPPQAYQTTITPQIKTVPIIQTPVIPIKTASALISQMTKTTTNGTVKKYPFPNTFLFGQNYQKRPQIYNVHMQKQNITIPRIPKTTYTQQNNIINQQSNQPRPLTSQTAIQPAQKINSGQINTFTNTTPNNDAWVEWALNENDNGPCPDKPGEFTVRGEIIPETQEYTNFVKGPVKNLYAKYYPEYIPPNWVNDQQYNQQIF